MLPKSHHFSSLLASQNDPQNQKKTYFGAPTILDFYVFSLWAFFKNSCFASARASFFRFPVLAKFSKIYVFLICQGSGAHFFRFWSVLGISKIDPEPSKVSVSLQLEHDFQKVMFFLNKKQRFQKHDFS